MPETLTLAHLSDVHLAPLPPFWPWHWNLKRGLGYANWTIKRRHVHLRAVVDRLVADLRAQDVDHIAVSGDLTNIGLPEEHARALEWLRQLGPPDRVSVVPGNHDIYCPLWTDTGTARWHAYMSGSAGEAGTDEAAAADFPFLRRLGDFALVGVNSAVPTAIGVAAGEIGAAQLGRLDRLLARLAGEDVCRIVMVHHPPLPGQAKPTRALRDAEDLQRLLERHGAELVLHGHNHRNMLAYAAAGGHAVPVVGVPSLSVGVSHHGEPLGVYNLYRVTRAANGFEIEMIQRGLAERDGDIVEISRHRLTPQH